MKHKMNLLIVDDSERMRRMIKSLVKGVVAQVYECSDGSQALDAYTRHHPDWVFVDIEMKEVDGITATRQIMAAFPNARIVIVSNHDCDDLREAAFQRGGLRVRRQGEPDRSAPHSWRLRDLKNGGA